MRLRILLLCCAALALTVGVATATGGGGNSENAKKCQKGGWQNFVRQDGTPFNNKDECVSYAAKGGTLKPGTPDLTISPGDFIGGDTYQYRGNFPVLGAWSTAFTVTNGGTATSRTLNLSAVTFTDFTLSNDTCTGSVLAPHGGTCTFHLAYAVPAGCSTLDQSNLFLQVDGQNPFVHYIQLAAFGYCP